MSRNFHHLLWRSVWGGAFVLFALSFWRNLHLHQKNQQELAVLEEQVQLLESQNTLLEQQVQAATSSFRLEERARQELRLQKPGETLYLPQ